MRFVLIRSLLFVLALSVTAGTSVKAQATKPTAGADAKSKSAAAAKASAEFRRVPQYFAQVDLSPDQREKLYSIREKHARKLDQLEAELASERAAAMTESEAVLTAPQRAALNKLRVEGKAKAAAKSKSTTKKAN